MRLLLATALQLASAYGAADCGACHPREAAESSKSAHAQSLKPVMQSRFYRSLPGRPVGEARGGFLLEFGTSGNAVEVTSRRGSERATARISWVFGAGRRAETPVAVLGSEPIELRVSYYSIAEKFDLTLGHNRGISSSATAALGVPQSSESMGRCFGCHSTGGLPGSPAFEPGVGCVACHAGAREHSEHASAVADPGRLSANALIGLCGTCHRTEPEGDPDDPINVRYQVVRLKRSRCFASGKLSCLTCHAAHSDARTDAAWYRGRCLQCHPGQSAKGNCVECHMPVVALNSRLSFTDHWIRKRS
jgi:hypothetical protein